MKPPPLKPSGPTQYGFVYGSMEVKRVYKDHMIGYVIMIETDRETLMIRATPGGQLRIGEIEKKKKIGR